MPQYKVMGYLCFICATKFELLITAGSCDCDLTAGKETASCQKSRLIMRSNAIDTTVRDGYNRFEFSQKQLIVEHDALICDADESRARALTIKHRFDPLFWK